MGDTIPHITASQRLGGRDDVHPVPRGRRPPAPSGGPGAGHAAQVGSSRSGPQGQAAWSAGARGRPHGCGAGVRLLHPPWELVGPWDSSHYASIWKIQLFFIDVR